LEKSVTAVATGEEDEEPSNLEVPVHPFVGDAKIKINWQERSVLIGGHRP